MNGRPFSPLFGRRWRFAAACVAASLGATAPACLPDVDFGSTTDAGDSSDVLAPPADAPFDSSDAHVGDSSTDAPSADGPSDGGLEAETGPSTLGLYVASLTDTGDPGFCAVRGGQLYCWGDNGANGDGQLGLSPIDTPDAGGHARPTLVTSTVDPASQITMMAMGGRYSCSLYGRSTYCRGDNGYAQLGNAQATSDVPAEVPVVGLPAGGLDIISAAESSTCGITLTADAGSAGSNVFCWGANGEGELGRPIGTYPQTAVPVTGDVDAAAGGPLGTIPDAIAIAGGGYHHCAISKSRGILCWGSNPFFESGPVAGSTNCPGGNAGTCLAQPQQITLPAGEVPAALALGVVHSCVLTKAENVYCWGWNYDDELGNGAGILPQMCTDGDGNTGPCTGTPVKVAIANVKVLRAGGESTCAIDDQRHAYCWGLDNLGQIGNGAPPGNDVDAPQELLDPTTFDPFTFDDISVGSWGACANDGDNLYCWGAGSLGTTDLDGSTPMSNSPALVLF